MSSKIKQSYTISNRYSLMDTVKRIINDLHCDLNNDKYRMRYMGSGGSCDNEACLVSASSDEDGCFYEFWMSNENYSYSGFDGLELNLIEELNNWGFNSVITIDIDYFNKVPRY